MLSKKKDAEDIRKQKNSSQSLGLPGLGNLCVVLTLSMDSGTEHQGDNLLFSYAYIYIKMWRDSSHIDKPVYHTAKCNGLIFNKGELKLHS